MDTDINELQDEIDESKNVDDSAEKEKSLLSDRFTITSYGADFPVDALVKRVKNGSYFVPPFQRLFVWNTKQASRFIESLLLGLPVPGIFVFKEEKTGKHLIIDGQQRLKSLESFYRNNFKDRAFRLLEVREPWCGKTYEELEQDDRQRLDDSIIHTTIFRQDEPSENDQSVYEVFERINSGGVKLSAQEIRSCVNFGRATTLLVEMNRNDHWRAIFGKESNRLKDQELILRFIAMHESLKSYKNPMSGFLNKKMEELKKYNTEHLRMLFDSWGRTIEFCRYHLGQKVFRPGGPLNAAVFDSITTAIARRLHRGPIIDPTAAKAIYDELLNVPDFQDAYEGGTSDEERVRTRMVLATAAFEKLK